MNSDKMIYKFHPFAVDKLDRIRVLAGLDSRDDAVAYALVFAEHIAECQFRGHELFSIDSEGNRTQILFHGK